MIFPLAYSLQLSTFDHYMPRPSGRFVGLGNYVELLSEERFWHATGVTLRLVAAAIAIEAVLGFILAYGLYHLRRGAAALMVLMFLPHIITPVVASLLLRWMFVSRWGLIDATLAAVDLYGPDWLGSPVWARVAIVLADAWKYTPFVTLVFYAGLQGLDEGQVEAARLDGANGWQLVRHVVLPGLKPLILFVLAIRSMDCFRVFDSIYVLTGGGPGVATETLTYYNYTLAFRLFEMGKAAALGVLTLAILAATTGCLIAWLYRRERGAF
jgi:multiple sugar transport system permease protein